MTSNKRDYSDYSHLYSDDEDCAQQDDELVQGNEIVQRRRVSDEGSRSSNEVSMSASNQGCHFN